MNLKQFLEMEKQQTYFQDIIRKVKIEYYENECFPKYENIFKAYDHENSIKVVIFGQDPYHQNNQATGLAFAVDEKLVIKPPSFKNIIKAINNEYNTNAKYIDLNKWHKQNVLLLNTKLTVQKGQPNSHKNINWEQLIENTINFLNNQKQPIVFLLWGNEAQKYAKQINTKKHLIIKNYHPSPLSAYRGFFKINQFTKVNNFLIKNKIPPIIWVKETYNENS